MTERKPPGVSFDSWIDMQIRAAEERGEFDDLPGAGKPLPKNDRPGTELDWLAQKLYAEHQDVSSLLPPSLALAREVEDLPQRVQRERTEDKVREIVEDLNERIRDAYRTPHPGPPIRTVPVDVEEVVTAWREAR
ncbi:DUF1992 domain-containing protein [Amycolatopsis anabasis]|uniref:DnaJ family domain-containing protein n=1 Tax=Amycolatopsis anabasis TaxID=1840409 RepID=UPI00131C2E83|nr:DUF1992 domain-containing protein [Amycolatopsis anabasis]